MQPDFSGLRFSSVEVCGAKVPNSIAASNSGLGAIYLAKSRGARRIILLGYDCKVSEDGKRHWHGDHPQGLGNANGVASWPAQFLRSLPNLVGITVINCSRDTALTMYARMELEEALCC